MNFLLRPNTYSKYCVQGTCSEEQLLYAMEHPQVFARKEAAPLAIYGSLVDAPELDEDSGKPRVIAANVDTLDAIQLDFDSGKTMDGFANDYPGMRWYMYTSYSHGYKGDTERFRVVIPLATPMPCRLLASRRVRKNLEDFNFKGCDRTAWDRGHWQLGPCIRAAGAPYEFRVNEGAPWGGDDYWEAYDRMLREEEAENEERMHSYAATHREVDESRLLAELEASLQVIPVNQGVRHDSAKRILARYAHKGIAHLLPSVPCPWPEPEWDREWQNLTQWASALK